MINYCANRPLWAERPIVGMIWNSYSRSSAPVIVPSGIYKRIVGATTQTANGLDKKNIMSLFKDMTIGEFGKAILEAADIRNDPSEVKDIYLTRKDLISRWPNVFSKYTIPKFIKEDNLPVMKFGKEELFLESDILKWLKNKYTEAVFQGGFN